MYSTQDRLRGPKGAKTLQTRRRTYLLFGEFCDNRCWRDWFKKFGERAVNHFGRIVEPIKLTEENAWKKMERYSWQMENNEPQFYWWNSLTDSELPMTQEQYDNASLVRP